MRRMSKLKILLLAGVMGMSLPMTSMASPEFSRTAGEWSSLRDNVLEYGEIADLIHEYNVTVQNNRYEYNEFIKDYGKKKDDVAQAYRDLADDLEAEKSGDDSAMSRVSDLQLDIQAKQLREQADDNLEDSEIHYLSYSQAEDNLVLSAQSKFISYYKNQLELEAAEAQKKTLENTETLTAAKRQAGMATEADVLSAQESVLEQEKTISGLKQEIERTRQELIIMLGWKGSDQPEITGQADQETALEKNYTLRINRKKLENADDADSKAKIKNTISGNERQIEVSVTNAWEGLQTGKLSYEQAVSDAAAEARNMEQAVQKWSAGMITRYDYEQQQAALTKKELAVKTAELNLIDLLETYRWNVNGLASAE